ncbi:hypothetical protein [Flocculibacter collagenilyticus]|uniref:hypothetical protein n=1 Tax=Flocculibacter collagenilyticus TaxID=2744479 RepID=UPI0018F5B8EC|nr:hypothetical protein [Flocculibacter collagenilyticus]
MSLEKNYLVSGRNTLIHKVKKIDLVLVNDDGDPPVLVSHNGLTKFDKPIPKNRREAKEQYLEVVQLTTPEIFGDRKTLVFIQALDGKEYKIDYSKVGTPLFIAVHQDSFL